MDENRIGTSAIWVWGGGEMLLGNFFLMHRYAIILAALERWNSFLTSSHSDAEGLRETLVRVCWVVVVDVDGLRPACACYNTCVHGKRVTVGRFSLDIT